MNTVTKALELAEPFLNMGYWVRIHTVGNRCSIDAGPTHDNGMQESATYSAFLLENGSVIESHRRI